MKTISCLMLLVIMGAAYVDSLKGMRENVSRIKIFRG